MGKGLADHVVNRPVRDKTAPQFAPDSVRKEQPELRRQRLIEAKARARRGKALLVAAIPFEILRRVAGQHTHQNKRQNINANERWNKLDEPSEKILKHSVPESTQEGGW